MDSNQANAKSPPGLPPPLPPSVPQQFEQQQDDSQQEEGSQQPDQMSTAPQPDPAHGQCVLWKEYYRCCGRHDEGFFWRHADTCDHSAYDRANVYPFPWSDPEQQPFVQNKLRRYEAIRSVLPPDCMGYRGLRLPFQHLATDPPCSAISCHHCIFDDHFQSSCRLAEFRYIRPNDSPSLALAHCRARGDMFHWYPEICFYRNDPVFLEREYFAVAWLLCHREIQKDEALRQRCIAIMAQCSNTIVNQQSFHSQQIVMTINGPVPRPDNDSQTMADEQQWNWTRHRQAARTQQPMMNSTQTQAPVQTSSGYIVPPSQAQSQIAQQQQPALPPFLYAWFREQGRFSPARNRGSEPSSSRHPPPSTYESSSSDHDQHDDTPQQSTLAPSSHDQQSPPAPEDDNMDLNMHSNDHSMPPAITQSLEEEPQSSSQFLLDLPRHMRHPLSTPSQSYTTDVQPATRNDSDVTDYQTYPGESIRHGLYTSGLNIPRGPQFAHAAPYPNVVQQQAGYETTFDSMRQNPPQNQAEFASPSFHPMGPQSTINQMSEEEAKQAVDGFVMEVAAAEQMTNSRMTMDSTAQPELRDSSTYQESTAECVPESAISGRSHWTTSSSQLAESDRQEAAAGLVELRRGDSGVVTRAPVSGWPDEAQETEGEKRAREAAQAEQDDYARKRRR